jgi:hypothetical protein
MDSLEQILCLAPHQKMVRTKKVANDQKINLASYKLLVFFFVKKRHNLLFPKITYEIVFSSKKWCLSANQSGIEEL